MITPLSQVLVMYGGNTHTIFKPCEQSNFRGFQWSAYFRQAVLATTVN